MLNYIYGEIYRLMEDMEKKRWWADYYPWSDKEKTDLPAAKACEGYSRLTWKYLSKKILKNNL